MDETLGPAATEILAVIVAAALTWWRTRKAIARVEQTTAVQVAAAHETASKAKAEARAAQVQLAEIRGSLRPSASSGAAWEAVRIDGPPLARPASSSPPLDEVLPPPADVPREVREAESRPTRPDRRER